MKIIYQLDLVKTNRNLKERLAKLPVNMKFKSSSMEGIRALKSKYNENMRSMSKIPTNTSEKDQTVNSQPIQKPKEKCEHCSHCTSVGLLKNGEIYSVD
ncbi:Signal peptide region containing protein [Cryptosporidium meleagridis]